MNKKIVKNREAVCNSRPLCRPRGASRLSKIEIINF